MQNQNQGETPGPCEYCQGEEHRLALAGTLESGGYREQPREKRHAGRLRDSQDRYTVTGVAAHALCPTVWVRTEEGWAAYWYEEITPEAWESGARAMPREVRNPDPEQLARLQRHAGNGDTTGCPEITAHLLGIIENERHADRLEMAPRALTPRQREDAGIPGNGQRPLPIDLLDFGTAASLIRALPRLMGDCACGRRD